MRVLVLDTETIGKISQDLINVGYKIIDIDFRSMTYKTLLERDYIMTDLINNEIYCINDDLVGAQKYARFVIAIDQKKAIKRNIKSVLKTLDNDIKKYGALFAYAFNCDFDTDKISKAGYEFPIPVYDIWAYAYEFITKTDDYKKWAVENDQLAPSGRYISGGVQAITRYLTHNLDFEESHTALSDVQNETEILMESVRRGADITRPLPRAKNIKSDKVFKKIIRYNGTDIEIEYTTSFERNGVITYK